MTALNRAFARAALVAALVLSAAVIALAIITGPASSHSVQWCVYTQSALKGPTVMIDEGGKIVAFEVDRKSEEEIEDDCLSYVDDGSSDDVDNESDDE